jgi:NCS1 family nucleobase:cation symporter-1
MDDPVSSDAELLGDDTAQGFRRRSTWRRAADPGRGGAPEADAADAGLDDDALADALAEQVAQVTASMPIITPEMLSRANGSAEDLFQALMDEPQGSEREPVVAAVPEPAPAQAEFLEPVFESAGQQEAPMGTAPIEEPTRPTAPAQPFDFSFPAPDAADQVWESDVIVMQPEGGWSESFMPSSPPAAETAPEPVAFASAPTPERPAYLPSEPPRYDPGQESWLDLALLPQTDAVIDTDEDELAAVSSPPAGDSSRFAPPPVSTPRPLHDPELDVVDAPTVTPPPFVPPPPAFSTPAPFSSPPSGAEFPGVDMGAFLSSAPPPAPATAVVPPPGSALPEPPRRRSLDDDALAAVLSSENARGGVSGALAELEVQMQFRADDAKEFASWERSLQAIGTPEALSAIDRAKATLGDRFATDIAIDGSAAAPSSADDLSADEVFDLEATVAYMPPAEMTSDGTAEAPSTSTDADVLADAAHVDETDRAWVAEEATPAVSTDAEASTPLPVPPPAPVTTDDAPVFEDETVVRQRAVSIEANEGEPTLLELRTGRAARMFWQWFALNSSIVSIAVGAALFSLGMSVRQSLVAVLAGVALSLLPLGLATLAGKWSGQPTMIVSRAAFGVIGNLLPAALAVITRVFWGAVFVWVIAMGITAGTEAAGFVMPSWFPLAVVAATLLLAAVIGVFGYLLFLRFATTLGILSAILIAGVVALTAPGLDFSAALSVPDGSWLQVAAGAVLVFSVIGLAWANSGAEVARYQRSGGSGAASIAWTIAGTAIPALLLLGYGVLLASASPELGGSLQENPIAALGALLPTWYPIPLTAALVLSLVCGVVLTVYSGAFSLQAAGVTVRRPVGVIVITLFIGAVAALLLAVTGDLRTLFADVATTIAVPVAAWAGIFACDLMIRNERFDGAALMRRGGVYGDVNWANVGMLIVASAVGFGFTAATITGLEWQGYLWAIVGVDAGSPFATSDLGVVVALVLGLITPLVSGIPRIRRQERA